jgi:hypothetical protein
LVGYSSLPGFYPKARRVLKQADQFIRDFNPLPNPALKAYTQVTGAICFSLFKKSIKLEA